MDSNRTNTFGGWVRSRLNALPDEVGVFAALLVLIIVVGVLNPNFLSQRNMIQLVASSAYFGVIAAGMVFLLALGEIDLSVGWSFNFAGVIAALMMVSGIDPWVAAFGGIAFGATLGAANGVLTIVLGLPAIIVTLGTLSVFQGLSLVVTQSRAIIPPDTSSSFFAVTNSSFFGVPFVAIGFALVVICLHVVFRTSRFGYRVQAIGSNKEAAALAGIPIWSVKLAALVLMGALCGLAGVTFVGVRQAIDPTTGGEFVLVAIAAAVIGGTPVTGGMGSIIGAFFGALIISTIRSGVIFLGVDARWSTFVTGAVILIAVAIDRALRAQRDRSRAGGS